MELSPIPPDEEDRLRDLYALDILYTPPEEAFDRITARLAQIFEVPVATLSLIDRDVQHYKSEIGLPSWQDRVVPRDSSICGHVVGVNETLIVDDLTQDRRFADNPAVVKAGARFYAGTPLRTDAGHAIGSLCIIDTKPRHLSDTETQLLRMIADAMMTEMKLRNATLRLAQRNREVEHDLVQARNVQRYLLPPECVAGEGFAICHSYHPYDRIGGDLVDVQQREDGTYALLLADVTGHGISAALMSAMAKTAFSRIASEISTPAELLTALNRHLSSSAQGGRFMTALAGIFDPLAFSLQLASAGHPEPILLRDRVAQNLSVASDLPLMLDPDLRYSGQTLVQLQASDRLLLYTDGAVEARRGSDLLGLERFQRILEEQQTAPRLDFLKSIHDAVRTFAHNILHDDIALLSLETF